MRLDAPRHHVARHDAAGRAVDDDQVQHFVPRVHGHLAQADLPLESLISAQEELLARLPAGIERARNLGSAKRPVRQQAAIFPSERNSLGHTLIDDFQAYLG